MENQQQHRPVLKRIKITNLFNTFNHTIDIKYEQRITLVLGENGLGKTVILKLLKTIFEGEFLKLKNFEFERLDLTFDDYKYSFFGTTDIDNPRLFVNKFKGRTRIESHNFLDDFDENSRQSRLWSTAIGLSRFENDFLYSNERYHEELEYQLRKIVGGRIRFVGRDKWLDMRTDEIVPTATIIKRYSRFLPSRLTKVPAPPEWLDELVDMVKVYIIETQRLRTRKGADNYVDAITRISEELANKIKEVLAKANEFATQLDRTYPTRLLTKISDPESITDLDIINKLEKLDSRRKRLKEVGLVDPFEEDIQRNNIIDRSKESAARTNLINNVLLVYIQDSNKKLDIYEELANKLEVFLNILNSRLNVKEILIDKEKGLDTKSLKRTGDVSKKKKGIPLTGLSSGEQHMIIMFYNLLFKCEKDSLILIDEPEISLHIEWQNKFIDDLNEIKKINPFDAIIATHSPDIINENWDLTVQLLED